MFSWLFVLAQEVNEDAGQTKNEDIPIPAYIDTGFSPVFAILLFVLSIIGIIAFLAYYFNYQATLMPKKKRNSERKSNKK